MLEKGFLRNQNKNKHQQIADTVSKVLLYIGVIVLIGTFGYLIINWGKSGALVSMMTPFLMAGLGFVFISFLVKRGSSRLR